MKGAERRTRFLDDLRKRRRYWELKEESEDRKKIEKTVHQSNIRKKYTSSMSPWTL